MITRKSMERMELPYGTGDLWSRPTPISTQPRQVRCYVRGCRHVLTPPSRGQRGSVCPEHGIRCHYSTTGATYSYPDARRNIIASPDLFGERIVHHPFKYESHRMGFERSEDAVSWNLFRSLAELGSLRTVAEIVTGLSHPFEPDLYLWGIKATDDSFEPWDLLVQARRRFEANLPVERPLTEPDIALHLPGNYLILIEAKFTSPNGIYAQGPRKDKSSLTFDELLGIYDDSRLRILDVDRARALGHVYYQLWRNMVFAEWMARLDSPSTVPYHANLVREGYEEEAEGDFRQVIRPEFMNRFQRITWEGIYARCVGPEFQKLRRYFETKTAGLQRAFDV